jgi:hypothetical protein
MGVLHLFWCLEGNAREEIDRDVPRKPRLLGGIKGHNMKRNYLTGKPRPVAVELQNLLSRKEGIYGC